MHNPRKIVKVSPVFTSVSQTFDDFCRQKCFTSPCLAKNKQGEEETKSMPHAPMTKITICSFVHYLLRRLKFSFKYMLIQIDHLIPQIWSRTPERFCRNKFLFAFFSYFSTFFFFITTDLRGFSCTSSERRYPTTGPPFFTTLILFSRTASIHQKHFFHLCVQNVN